MQIIQGKDFDLKRFARHWHFGSLGKTGQENGTTENGGQKRKAHGGNEANPDQTWVSG
ncbi:hypothetical protein [Silvimonas sp.]|uniref:hypothetical protein n=1 Tax=Silvimonas sp. TaxID=2650811 RepID=UPI00283E2CD8|nr:hypothetical protein [Silvimonas sp.]MDR3429486.1 hypothetical protein [Silvimonas sp.]